MPAISGQAPLGALGPVGPHRDRHRDRTRTHGQGQRQRIECLAHVVRLVAGPVVAFRSPSSSSVWRSSAQPVETTTSPPPTCTTGSEIPKKPRMWVPMKIDARIRTRPFIAIIRASLRARSESPRVNDEEDGSVAKRIDDRKQRAYHEQRVRHQFAEDRAHKAIMTGRDAMITPGSEA